MEFPENFFFGSATSSYQVEGGNKNSDWCLWEKNISFSDPSGAACSQYEKFPEDFRLASNLGHNAHRLSIEWSRIEPEEGFFDQEQISHYKEVIRDLKKNNLEPIITLHHFSNPIWFSQKGGWEKQDNIEFFLSYVKTIVKALSDDVKFWVSINEPVIYAYYSYFLGDWPPQKTSLKETVTVMDNMAKAHIQAYSIIKNIYFESKLKKPMISIAKHFIVFEYCDYSLKNKIAVMLRDWLFNFRLVNRLNKAKTLDFIGVNYYTRKMINVKRFRLKNLLSDECEHIHHDVKKNFLGWHIYPQGLLKILLRLKKYKVPVFILENGICTEDDSVRWEFIYDHLLSVLKAINKGINVIGYLYWSLLDNFEWDKGYAPKFGLVKVDFKSQKRTVRESALKYGKICRTRKLEVKE